MNSSAHIATNRFGLGAKPNELAQASDNPKAWLKKQLVPLTLDTDAPSSSEILVKLRDERLLKKANKIKGVATPKDSFIRNAHKEMSLEVVGKEIAADNSLMWRLLDFFSNHFSVSAQGQKMVGLSPTLEREAIAPNLLGSFDAMLLAVEKHPAMLIYLNNERSIGPNSPLGKKRAKGLNENLAREILELHTLGVDGGYNQQDVTELAKAITGWSVSAGKKQQLLGYKYYHRNHEPGARTLLNKTYRQKGELQGEQMLKDLAMQPSTAQHICYKLVHHFISDTPSPKLVAAMKATWLSSNGNIKAVLHTLIDAPESWHNQAEKLKTPREYVVSTLRALQPETLNNKWLWNSLRNLGHQPFQAGSPAGFSDDQQDWSGASALMAKIDWVSALTRKQRRQADTIMQASLGDSVSQRTYQHVMRAESRSQALALLLLSPEFQKR